MCTSAGKSVPQMSELKRLITMAKAEKRSVPVPRCSVSAAEQWMQIGGALLLLAVSSGVTLSVPFGFGRSSSRGLCSPLIFLVSSG